MNKFENEYEYLVHLIKFALKNEQPTEKPETISFSKVFEIGKAHEVANIAFISVEKLKNKPEEALYDKWISYYGKSVRRHINQINARDKIVNALNEAKIRHVEVQGTIMKTLYPHSEWRMMCDIDFIIDKESLDVAEEVMKMLGYNTRNPNGVEVNAFGKNAIAVELHSDFFDPNSIGYKTITDVFSYSQRIGNTYSYKASETIFYLYNLLHCIKHFLQRGAGIRRIMDMYIMREALLNKVDIVFINEILTKTGYKKVADEIFAVVDKWFSDSQNIQELKNFENKIYLSNNHGSKKIFYENQYDRCDKKGKRFFKLNKFLKMLFPSKKSMYLCYPFCEKHKFPTIICWLYRLFKTIFDPYKLRRAFKRFIYIKNIDFKNWLI